MKEGELREAQNQLAEVNRKQEALQHIQTEFEGLKPDIQIICDNLAIFAEVWASVRRDLFSVLFSLLIRVIQARSQSIDFANTLEQGMDVLTRAVRIHFIDLSCWLVSMIRN